MTLLTVAPDEAIQASLMNQIIANINGSPGLAIFTSTGTWAVPSGVHRFRVSLCGGGGSSGPMLTVGSGIDAYSIPGYSGGNSIARRVIVTGADIGTSYSITVGGPGGTSSFGTLLSISGGGDGTTSGKGSVGGVAGGSLAASSIAISNQSIAIYDSPRNEPRGYGEGGPPLLLTAESPYAGAPGIVIIEW
jgi:hypothetical protein